MATSLLPSEPPKPTVFDLILRALYILIPVCVSAFATYKQGQSESGAGYKALATTVVQLQQEVTELQAQDEELQAQMQALVAQLQAAQQAVRSDARAKALKLAAPVPSPAEVAAPKTVTSPEAAPAELRPLKRLQRLLKPPPATLREAVQAE